MESNKYLEDLASIKTMMHKSSRFMSLSGLSGILAGIYALVGAYAAHLVLSEQQQLTASAQQYTALTDLIKAYIGHPSGTKLALIGLTVLLAAVITGIALTIRKAKRQSEKIWDASSKRLIYNFVIPLATGGAFCIVLMQYGLIGLIARTTLIFYGLALVNASKFTIGDIKYLGIVNISIGLVATQFIGYGLYFWALGFGVFHIVYGVIMHRKYD